MDSCSVDGTTWISRDDIADLKPHTCSSVGFLVREDDSSVTIVAHLSPHQFSGDMTIPKFAITDRRALR